MYRSFFNSIVAASILMTSGIYPASLAYAAKDQQVLDICMPNCTSSIAISWTAPTTRADGTTLSLSELEGYRIYLGSDSENLTPVVDLADSSINSYTLTGLVPGTYYISVTAYDYDGLESVFAQPVSQTIF